MKRLGILISILIIIVYALIGFNSRKLIVKDTVYRDTLIEQRVNSIENVRDTLYLPSPQPVISHDGRFIAFSLFQENTVPSYLSALDLCIYDRENGAIISKTRNVSLAGFTEKGNILVLFQTGKEATLRDLLTGQQWPINIATDGTTANKSIYELSISADSRYAVFSTDASNLVANDKPGSHDIFIRDNVAQKTRCISVTTQGKPANHRSNNPVISADGNIIAFTSLSANLVADNTKGIENVFVYNRDTGLTSLISKSNNGISGNAGSRCIDMTSDAKYILFSSDASNLVPANKRQKCRLYVADRLKNNIVPIRLEKDYGLVNGNFLSDDGQRLVFTAKSTDKTFATNRIGEDIFTSEIFLHDRNTGKTACISEGSAAIQVKTGLPFHDNIDPSSSEDGRYICYLASLSNVSPTSSAGIPRDKKWKNIISLAYAIQIYDCYTQKTSTILLETDLPKER